MLATRSSTPAERAPAAFDAKANLLLLADGNNLTTEGTRTSMEATEVDSSPADSEFEPPYPVQSLPGQ